MANEEIKTLLKENGICLYELADRLGMQDSAWSRKLRKPLTKEEYDTVMNSIQNMIAGIETDGTEATEFKKLRKHKNNDKMMNHINEIAETNNRSMLFMYARTKYNKNGIQTQSDASDASGIDLSFIQRMEDEHNFSHGSAVTTAKLAKYYGVTTDYLLGLTNEPYRQAYVSDELGISEDAVRWIKNTSDRIGMNEFEKRILTGVYELEFSNDVLAMLDAMSKSENREMFEKYIMSDFVKYMIRNGCEKCGK